MKVSESIKLLFERTGAKKKDIAKELGYESPTFINNAMARENLTIDLLVRMCKKMGYEVVLRPQAASKNAADIVIDTPKKDGVSK